MTRRSMLLLTLTAGFALCLSAQGEAAQPAAYFQCHRGGLEEVPENTLPAVEHAWSIPGGVPEVDLRTTADGVIVCLHDRSLERTCTTAEGADATGNIDELTYEQAQAYDAGTKFSPEFKGTRIPSLIELFIRMVAHPQRELYLDLKAVELPAVVALIDQYNLRDQILFVHGSPAMCERLSQLWRGARVMTWISDPPEVLKKRFERLAQENFHSVTQLQFHLHANPGGPPYAYQLDDDYLKQAQARLQEKGIQLQLRLFEFDPAALDHFLKLGISWYVTDAPKAFHQTLTQAIAVAP